jgi:hypothetical protein
MDVGFPLSYHAKDHHPPVGLGRPVEPPVGLGRPVETPFGLEADRWKHRSASADRWSRRPKTLLLTLRLKESCWKSLPVEPLTT